MRYLSLLWLAASRVHAEWITLHDYPNFRGFVDFLRTELDRVGPAHADPCRDFFSRAVALKLSFFEAAYEFS
jgi:thiaminase (transcriptional activator TenA)